MTLLLSLLLSAAQPAHADEMVVQDLVWDVALDGQKVGERSVTVKYIPDEDGTRRVIESLTSIDATAKGIPYTYEQRLTAHASEGPASFHSVVKDNGLPREIQGRNTPVGWTVSVVEKGRTRSWDLVATQVHLSSADLLDPETRVPLSALQEAKILSVETGDVITGDVENLGSSEVTIGGKQVPVSGLSWSADTGKNSFFYTSDGVLVRYELQVMGKSLVTTLRELPPPGIDDAPIIVGSAGIEESDL